MKHLIFLIFLVLACGAGQTLIADAYAEADGLINNDVRAMAIDQAGHVWFGTAGGVGESSP